MQKKVTLILHCNEIVLYVCSIRLVFNNVDRTNISNKYIAIAAERMFISLSNSPRFIMKKELVATKLSK